MGNVVEDNPAPVQERAGRAAPTNLCSAQLCHAFDTGECGATGSRSSQPRCAQGAGAGLPSNAGNQTWQAEAKLGEQKTLLL